MRIAWHPIKEHPNYEINRLGQIRSSKTGQILKPFDDNRGYLRVTLDGKNYKVHILVVIQFVPKPVSSFPLVVNHISGNKHDNRASQLEWVTQSENIKHAWEHGLIRRQKKMKIKLIDFGGAKPVRAHWNDAGADVICPKAMTVNPGDVLKIPLGFGVELPDGLAGFVFPRSSLSAKGIACELPPVDSGYRGEIHAIVSNVGNKTYNIARGERIGQLVIMPVVIPEFVDELTDERGTGAFGSSGRGGVV